jgi:hypothetical protein
MNGYQITFFTHQDRRHKGKQMCQPALGRREFQPWRPRTLGAFF